MAVSKKVFISYARKDASPLANYLQAHLTATGHDPWLDSRRIDASASWTREIEEALDGCDVFLALLTPGSFVSDLCRAEQLRALRIKKVVLPLLTHPDADLPLHLESRNYRDFTAFPPSQERLSQLLEDIATGRQAAGIPVAFKRTYVTAPPLPRNFVERPEALARLRQAVIADEPGPSIALTAVRGMGGLGKTTLAQALGHDDVTQQAFPDGVIWTTLGKDVAHNLTTRLQDVRRALGEQPDSAEGELECINRYRTCIREKSALIIVDDVWSVGDIQPFLAESSRSRILFTTRDATLVAATGAVEHQADLLTFAEARELLATWSNCPQAALPAEADDIVRQCGCLPLALSMVGAMLFDKARGRWAHVLELLRTANIAKVRAKIPFYPHDDLLRAIQVSVDALDPADQSLYLALAVLLDDMVADLVVQRILWSVDALSATEIADRFVDLSLAQRHGDAGAIRLHDLQLDYLRARHPDAGALQLIRGSIRLSSHIIAKDSGQFASQVVGRLLCHRDKPSIARFVDEIVAAAPRPWLRPLHPALRSTDTGLVQTLDGHVGGVNTVVVTADGRRAVSASADLTLKVWELDTGAELWTLRGHSKPVCAVAVTPDGTRAVSAAYDEPLKLWDLATGRELLTLSGPSGGALDVAILPDGKHAVSTTRFDSLKLWDLSTGAEVPWLANDGHHLGSTCVAVGSDGRLVVSGRLEVWDLTSRSVTRALAGHKWPPAPPGRVAPPRPGDPEVNAVVVTADGTRVLSAANDCTLKLWDLQTGVELRTLRGHSNAVCDVSLTPDGRHAVSASSDKTLKIWDLETGAALRTFGHEQEVTAVVVTPNGKQFLSTSNDQTIRIWNLDVNAVPQQSPTMPGHVECVSTTADGRWAVSSCADRTLRLWEVETGRIVRTIVTQQYDLYWLVVTPDRKQVVSGSRNSRIKVWDLETGAERLEMNEHRATITAMSVASDGRRVVSADLNKTVIVWDTETGSVEHRLSRHSVEIWALAVTADGQRVLLGGDDGSLLEWDVESGSFQRRLEGHARSIRRLAVAPDGKRAVSISWYEPVDSASTIKVWDLESGALLRTSIHPGIVNCVAIAPNEGIAAFAVRQTVEVWSIEAGLPVATFRCDSPPTSCAFAGHTRIVAGDTGGRTYFLEIEGLSATSA